VMGEKEVHKNSTVVYLYVSTCGILLWQMVSKSIAMFHSSIRFTTFVWQMSPDHQTTGDVHSGCFLNSTKYEALTSQTLGYREAAACTHGV
jgi:hypothetical protein